eukprot:6427963-Prymnesium_polylepis.1
MRRRRRRRTTTTRKASPRSQRRLPRPPTRSLPRSSTTRCVLSLSLSLSLSLTHALPASPPALDTPADRADRALVHAFFRSCSGGSSRGS